MSESDKVARSEALARRLAELADSKAASEIVVLDMRELVSYTDFLTICTARNERQARAIADEVKLRLKQEQRAAARRARRRPRRPAGSCSTTSTACCTSSPRRSGSATRSRTSGARRRGSSCRRRRMASEGTSTVPRMGSFKRALFGYRRSDVEAAIAARDARNWALERDAEEALKRWREAADVAAGAEEELRRSRRW